MIEKNISLTEEAYYRLRSLGKENESFSDTIMRITNKSYLDDYVGILSKESADALENTIKRQREKNRATRKRRIQRIVKALS